MPAKSKKQQRFMGMVYRCKETGKASDCSGEVGIAAKSMKKKDVEDFASTKHKGLPEKVKKKKPKKKKKKNAHLLFLFRFLKKEGLLREASKINEISKSTDSFDLSDEDSPHLSRYFFNKDKDGDNSINREEFENMLLELMSAIPNGEEIIDDAIKEVNKKQITIEDLMRESLKWNTIYQN